MGLMMLACAGIPLFYLMHSSTTSHALMAEVIFAIFISVCFGGLVALNVELLPPSVRCTGLALAYNLTLGLFGGTTPLVATWLVHYSDNPIAPGYWLVAAQVISLLAIWLGVRNTHLYADNVPRAIDPSTS